MESILQKLRLTLENPDFYKPLTPEEQAELFLYLFRPKKKLFQKPEVIRGIDGKDGRDGKDGVSKEEAQKMISALFDELRATVKSGKDGKDAVITEALLSDIASRASALIQLPDFASLITMEPEAIRNALELLQDDERLDVSAIRGIDEKIDEKVSKVPKGATAIIARRLDQIEDVSTSGVTDGQVLQYDSTTRQWSGATISGIQETYETVSKNLDASDATLNYTGDNLTSIEYANGVTKTLNYTGDNLTSVVLSGTTPSGIDLTKTLTYTGDNLTGVGYS